MMALMGDAMRKTELLAFLQNQTDFLIRIT